MKENIGMSAIPDHNTHPGSKHCQRILILQTAFIGDVILTLPLVQEIQTLFPQARIDVMAIPAARNLLETHPDIHKLWIYDKRVDQRGFRQLWRFIRQLRMEHYDLAVTPHRSIRSAAILKFAGITRRIGFDRSAGAFFFTDIIPYPYKLHEINRNLHLLLPFGIDAKRHCLPRLSFSPDDAVTLDRLLQEASVQVAQPMVVLAPGSVWATKRWLPEYFASLSNRLVQKGFSIALVGGADDSNVANQVQSLSNAPLINLVGALTLRQSALLIKRSALLVSNDSAPMHLAVAVHTPVIAIFGPTVQHFGFYPYGKRDRVAEIVDLPCRPCGRHGSEKCPIGTFDCMRQLMPEAVLHLAEDILKEIQPQ